MAAAGALAGPLHRRRTRRPATTVRFPLARDPAAAKRAITLIGKGMTLLREFPFTGGKADPANPFLRELRIPFGTSGYVALFENEAGETLAILAVRHQRESDYR